jgi:hypothetical protein
MDHSSIESLEPRWAPARLVAGSLPAEFGATLETISPEEAESLILHLPQLDPLALSLVFPGNPIPQIPIAGELALGSVHTGAGTLVLSGSVNFGQSTVSGGTLSFSGGSFSAVGGGTLSLYRPGLFDQVATGGVVGGSVTFSILRPLGTTIGLTNAFPGAILSLPLPVDGQMADGGELTPALIDQSSVAGPAPIVGSRLVLGPSFALGL